MSVTYTLSITKVATSQSDTLTDAVTRIEWKRVGVCSATGRTGQYAGMSIFEMADISPDGFVNYDDLTEETVKSWVQSSIDDDDEFEASINSFIQNKIDNPILPEQVKTSLPWESND